MVKRALHKARRLWAGSRASFAYGRAELAVLRAIGAAPRPTRILLISDGREYTSEQQFAPIHRHAGSLRRKLGVVYRHMTLPAALAASPASFSGFDIVGLKLSFRTQEAEVGHVLARLESVIDRKRTALVYFDGDDDQTVQWPEVLAWSDLYVKKHVFSDMAQYGEAFRATDGEVKRNNLTNYVAGVAGVASDSGLSAPIRDERLLGRIHSGWNIGLDDDIQRLSQQGAAAGEARKIDVLCRAFVPPHVWIAPMRNAALEAIDRLSGRFTVSTPRARVARAEYYREMRDSRICVSPFGYGELCWRDFEAIFSGCLLAKPDMGHVRTSPDIFVPGVTYVPLRWDYSDLEEKCAYYLGNEAERRRMVAAAQDALRSALTRDWFVSAFRHFLDNVERQRTAA